MLKSYLTCKINKSGKTQDGGHHPLHLPCKGNCIWKHPFMDRYNAEGLPEW